MSEFQVGDRLRIVADDDWDGLEVEIASMSSPSLPLLKPLTNRPDGFQKESFYWDIEALGSIENVTEPVTEPVTKPPLGVIPRNIWLDNRRNDLARAINEYVTTGLLVKPEWVEEYNDLMSENAVNW